eukprot:gene4697-9315_t
MKEKDWIRMRSRIYSLAAIVITLIFCYWCATNNQVNSTLPFNEDTIEYPRRNSISHANVFDIVVEVASTVYIIVGGGAGEDKDNGYPPWTRLRTLAAVAQYEKEIPSNQNRSLFLAMSAGSLNGPNKRWEDGRIIFECQHIISHLKESGIPSERLFGDFFSWDTLGNGFTLRLFVEGMLSFEKPSQGYSRKLRLEVFTSDFHVDRVRAAFTWILGLTPSLLPHVAMSIHIHDSTLLSWEDPSAFRARMEHEKSGVARIRQLSSTIRSATQMQAYLLLGGHQGLINYLRSVPSPRSAATVMELCDCLLLGTATIWKMAVGDSILK